MPITSSKSENNGDQQSIYSGLQKVGTLVDRGRSLLDAFLNDTKGLIRLLGPQDPVVIWF